MTSREYRNISTVCGEEVARTAPCGLTIGVGAQALKVGLNRWENQFASADRSVHASWLHVLSKFNSSTTEGHLS